MQDVCTTTISMQPVGRRVCSKPQLARFTPSMCTQTAFMAFGPWISDLLFTNPCATWEPPGFPGGNLPKTTGSGKVDEQQLQDCEITGDCDDLALEAAIR